MYLLLWTLPLYRYEKFCRIGYCRTINSFTKIALYRLYIFYVNRIGRIRCIVERNVMKRLWYWNCCYYSKTDENWENKINQFVKNAPLKRRPIWMTELTFINDLIYSHNIISYDVMRRFSSRLRRSTNKLSFIGFIIFRLQGGLVWEFNNYIYPSSTTNINIERLKKKMEKFKCNREYRLLK